MPAKIVYTREGFRQVARRRVLEARSILDTPKRYCDGATTCALLAAECALKATLLHGLGVDEVDSAPEKKRQAAFESKKGHDLSQLWSLQEQAIVSRKTQELTDALILLHQLDRYEHRYGSRRPNRTKAATAVAAAEVIVAWMEKEVT